MRIFQIQAGSNVKLIAISIFVFVLSACGSKLDGVTYEQHNQILGTTSLKFESKGRVYLSMAGTETELKYEVDGNKVKLITPQGNQILMLQQDGSLDGWPTGKLLKKNK